MPLSLSELRSRVNEVEKTLAGDRAVLKSLMSQLKDEFKCTSVTQAEKLLAKLSKDHVEGLESIRRKLERLEEDIVKAEESVGLG